MCDYIVRLALFTMHFNCKAIELSIGNEIKQLIHLNMCLGCTYLFTCLSDQVFTIIRTSCKDMHVCTANCAMWLDVIMCIIIMYTFMSL